MISLLYLLIFFINGRLLWLVKLKRGDPNHFEMVTAMKQDLQLTDLCSDKAESLLPFALEIYKLKFEDEPPYQKLAHLLRKALL